RGPAANLALFASRCCPPHGRFGILCCAASISHVSLGTGGATMSTIYLATLLLAAQPQSKAADYPLMAPPAVVLPAEPLSAAEMRKAQEGAIRQSYRTGVSDSVPELVKVFRLLEQDK